MGFLSLFRTQIRTYIYIPIYKGPFDYKRGHTKAYKYPFGINKRAIEEEFEEISQIRQQAIQASPFHLVWRYQTMSGIPWYEKIVLRRLGLHQRETGVRVILPNTPQFNKLLWEVKHLIRLKPVSFPDGIPTEKDIGSAKVNSGTGVMNISESYRVSNERLENSKSHDIYYGKYLREYLKWASGMFGKTLPISEVQQFDGGHISEFKHRVANANKHQHHLYNNNDSN